jgi:glucan 1,3-beta-glucosidase
VRQVRGVNLVGWLVLEPWITPPRIFQFHNTQQRFGDKAPEKTAMDMPHVLHGARQGGASRQLRLLFDNWVYVAELTAAGINSMSVPVGDWMFNPYELAGCTDDAVEALDRVADLALGRFAASSLFVRP